MRIHALCVVKNEGDIIVQGLSAALAWADFVYVLDNGSTDGTWEEVQRLSAEHPNIVAWKQEDAPFRDGLRADIYHAFKARAQPGDWWARLDPDEFYVDDPRLFLEGVPQHDGCVWYASLSFYFSTEDERRFGEDPALYAPSVPVAAKCRYYFNHWSEIRFVRHEAMEPWSGEDGWPEGLAARVRSHPRRILCRHFPYRSPQQIEQRLATRLAGAAPGKVFSHEAIKDWASTVNPQAVRRHRWRDVAYVTDAAALDQGWRSRVVDARTLHFDGHDGHFVVNEELMPPIPGAPQPLLRRLRQLVSRRGAR